MSKSEHRYWDLPRGDLSLTTRHEDRSVAAHLTHGRTKLRLAVYPLSERVSVGARVRLDRHSEEELAAGLYLGPLHLHAGVHHPLLAGALKLLGLGRAVTDAEVYLSGNSLDDIEGPRVIASGHLLDDDHQWSKASRAARVDLTALLLGKVQRSEPVVVDEREVTVCFPDGSFTTTARVMERQLWRPRGLFKRWERWVEFAATPVLVPWKGGGMGFFNLGGPTSVTGRTIEDGIGELTRRVLEQRARYGGRSWKHGPPALPVNGDSHEVSVWQVANGKETEVRRFNLFHGQRQAVSGVAVLSRCQKTGAVMVQAASGRALSVVHGDAQHEVGAHMSESVLLRQGDKLVITITGDDIHRPAAWETLKVYGSPVGPVWSKPVEPEAAPPSVCAADLMDNAKRSGFVEDARGGRTPLVNAGPAIARVGRMPLKGLTYEHIQEARTGDPQWYAANSDIVSGAREGLVFDGNAWTGPTAQEVASDVAEVAAQLDTTLSPGEAEEAVEDARNLLAEVLLDPESAAKLGDPMYQRLTMGFDTAAPGERDRTVETLVDTTTRRIESVKLVDSE